MSAFNLKTVRFVFVALVSGLSTPVLATNFLQDSGTQGLVSLESENRHVKEQGSTQHYWGKLYDSAPGYSGDQAIEAKPDLGNSWVTGYESSSAYFEFRVEFVHTGTHYVWVRGSAPSADSNLVHLGLDGVADANAANIDIPSPWQQLNWSSGSHTVNVSSLGTHNVTLWMGEDGVVIDKIVLTTDANYVPTGEGPAESGEIGPFANWTKAFVLPETTGNVVTVMDNDYHTEGESFWIDSVVQNWGSYGSFSVTPTGDAIVYDAPTPDSGIDETVHFTYTIIDAAGRIGEGSGVIIVSDNNFPTANDDSYTVTQGSSANNLPVLLNDTDPDGDPLSVNYTWHADQGGTISINATNDGIEYTPAAGFTGVETFWYKVTDGRPFSADQAIVTVTVQASGANQSPSAVDDAYTVDQDTTTNLSVLANDSDPDSDPLTISSLGSPSQSGVVTVSGSNISYTPVTGFVGLETFTYTIDDGNGNNDTAMVTMTVFSTNGAPVANDDAFTVNQGTTNNALTVLSNDTDPDSDPVTVSSVGTPDNGGTAVVNTGSDGIDYTPLVGFSGTETFTYTISDGQGGTDTATVTMTVDQVIVNLAPILSAIGNQSVTEGTPLSLSVSATDSDGPAPLSLTQTNTLPGSPSVLTDNGDGTGTLSWTPAVGDAANSPYTIIVTASDGLGATDVETVTVTVSEAQGGSATVDYTYNALGQRVTKTSGANVTHYIYDQVGQLIAEMDGATGQTVREYVYVNGEQMAVIDDTDTANEALYFVQNDHLGTPQQITDASEQVVWSADYAPFGEATILVNSIESNTRFPGQYQDDETGLHYNYFRTYDPSIGRYTQSDPIGLGGGINRYGYAYADPVQIADRFGLSPLERARFFSCAADANVSVRDCFEQARQQRHLCAGATGLAQYLGSNLSQGVSRTARAQNRAELSLEIPDSTFACDLEFREEVDICRSDFQENVGSCPGEGFCPLVEVENLCDNGFFCPSPPAITPRLNSHDDLLRTLFRGIN